MLSGCAVSCAVEGQSFRIADMRGEVVCWLLPIFGVTERESRLGGVRSGGLSAASGCRICKAVLSCVVSGTDGLLGGTCGSLCRAVLSPEIRSTWLTGAWDPRNLRRSVFVCGISLRF